eukprot:CAMPEP_0204621072 /NCGR_PEP_ID=MMETSP0717-20131115/6909_1 /ASSEMBLY_ACC=CAM_ASM_000666 /TAXON_ID=230516 /ORGANISM="Chaetoceros curvisetus" /LENGTH=686 /DNA_ID=CAMNT_0051635411 /DNA_START=191 /DNA_END=2251 /DNA_ORIENTATION=+
MQQFFQNIFGGRGNNNGRNGNGSGNDSSNGNNNRGANRNTNANSNANGASYNTRGTRNGSTSTSASGSGTSARSRPRPAGSEPQPASASSSQAHTQQARASTSQTRTGPRPSGGTTGSGSNNPNVRGHVVDNPMEFFAQMFGEGVPAHERERNNIFGLNAHAPPGFRFFANEAQAHAFANAAHEAAAAAQQPPSRPNPPASCKAIRQLPTVIVTPEDLVDENNRECCICLEPHNIGDRVIRLPCAHIYHPHCIINWLGSHSNTCPVCRYELSTDDAEFEQGREERMKQRKPRYARYELERMNVRELKDMAKKLKISPSGTNREFLEKKEVIDTILNSGKVIVVKAPEPIEYPSIGILRDMKIRQLKAAMEEAGVFFDPKDVVEKEDMVQIFVNSGRIVLTGEGEEKSTEDNIIENDYGHAPRVDEPQPSPRNYSEMKMEDDFTTGTDDNADADVMGMEKKRARFDDDSDSIHSTRSMRMRRVDSCNSITEASANGSVLSGASEEGDNDAKMRAEYEDERVEATASSEEQVSDHCNDDNNEEQTVIRTDQACTDSATTATSTSTPISTEDPSMSARESSSSATHETSTMTDQSHQTVSQATTSSSPTSPAPPVSLGGTATRTSTYTSAYSFDTTPSFLAHSHGITGRSVKELRQLAQELSVDLSSCVEKREMIDLIVAAVQRQNPQS